MTDKEGLEFDEFLSYIRNGSSDRPTPDRFLEVAEKIFKNKQKISGRTKVEVAYDVCEFFAREGLQTKNALQDLPKGIPYTSTQEGEPGDLEKMVMDRIVNGTPEQGKVKGIGLALGTYLLMCLGRTDFVKPDSLLLRLMGRIDNGDWYPKIGDVEDYKLIRQAITSVAEQIDRTPAAIDNALWIYESKREKRALDRFTWSSIDEVTITPPPEDESTNFSA